MIGSHSEVQQICGNCNYFKRTIAVKNNEPQKFGVCHRFPPTCYIGAGGSRTSSHPDVRETDWCGEFTKIWKTNVITGGRNIGKAFTRKT